VLIHSTGTTPNTTLYSGEQFDPDLNLYYNRARYLNVSTGRFWTVDSFEGNDQDPSSLHKYLYSGADPIDHADPSGKDFSLGEVLAVAIIITVISAIPTAHDSISQTKVEIHFDEIGALRRAHHAYLVLRDPSGVGYLFRGGPSVSEGCGGSSDASEDLSGSVGANEDLGCGYITEAGSAAIYGPGAIDYPKHQGDDVASLIVPDVHQSFIALLAGFEADANTIESLHLPYHPASQNSNSFAYTLLAKEHLDRPAPPVWSPGWDKILY
jgi:RHS repeat-associated protein